MKQMFHDNTAFEELRSKWLSRWRNKKRL